MKILRWPGSNPIKKLVFDDISHESIKATRKLDDTQQHDNQANKKIKVRTSMITFCWLQKISF